MQGSHPLQQNCQAQTQTPMFSHTNRSDLAVFPEIVPSILFPIHLSLNKAKKENIEEEKDKLQSLVNIWKI